MTARFFIATATIVCLLGCKTAAEKQADDAIRRLELASSDASFFDGAPERGLEETRGYLNQLKSAIELPPKNIKAQGDLDRFEEIYFANFKKVVEEYLKNESSAFQSRTQYEMTFAEAVAYAKTVANRNDPVINKFLARAEDLDKREQAAHLESLRINGDPEAGAGRRDTAGKLQEFYRIMGLTEFSSFASDFEDKTLNIYFIQGDISSSEVIDLVKRNTPVWHSEGFNKVVVVDKNRKRGHPVFQQKI